MNLTQGIIFGLIGMLGWGFADFFTKIVAAKIGFFRAYLWTQAIGIIPLFLYFLIFSRELPLTSTTALLIILIAVIWVISGLFFYKSLEIGKLTLMSPIQSSWVIITVVLSLIFLRESLSLTQAIAVVLIIAGAILASFNYRDILKLNLKKMELGVKENLLSVLLFGVMFVVAGYVIKQIGWFFPIFLVKILMAVFLLSYAAALSKKVMFKKRHLWLLMVLAGLFDVTAVLGWGIGVHSDQIALVSPIVAGFPAVAVVLGKLFLKEKIVLNQDIGIAVLIIGLILISF